MRVIKINENGFLTSEDNWLVTCPLKDKGNEDFIQCTKVCAWFQNTNGIITCGDKIIGKLCK